MRRVAKSFAFGVTALTVLGFALRSQMGPVADALPIIPSVPALSSLGQQSEVANPGRFQSIRNHPRAALLFAGALAGAAADSAVVGVPVGTLCVQYGAVLAAVWAWLK